jgi:hypothetical protein
MNHLIRNGIDFPLGNGDVADAGVYGLEKGEWNATENMVYVKSGATASGFTLASPTQYYNVRKAAMHVLYISANSNGIDNGLKNVASISYEFAGLTAVNTPVTIEGLGTDEITGLSVVANSGTLPSGLTLSNLGVLSGTPTTSGNYSFTIQYLADGWVKKTSQVNIKITELFNYSGSALSSASTTSAFSGAYTQSLYVVGESIPFSISGYAATLRITSVAFAVSGGALPDGLTLAAGGALTGTPTAAGTYTFNVRMTVSGTASLFGMSLPQSIVFTQPYTVVVA